MKKYIKFTENNDWEGESWNFYLELDGNEKEIKKLQELLTDYEINDFALRNEFDESDVDILVKHTDSSYLHYENKIEGKFNIEKLEEEIKKNKDNALYKGKICVYFKKNENCGR